jgi:hypothetical protein
MTEKSNDPRVESPNSDEMSRQKRNSRLKSEALIIAALMGTSTNNSMSNNNNSNPKKFRSQMSSPAQFSVSPVFVGDTPTTSFVEKDNKSPNIELTSFKANDVQGSLQTNCLAANNYNNNNNNNNNNNTNNNNKNLRISSNNTKASKCMLNYLLLICFFIFF